MNNTICKDFSVDQKKIKKNTYKKQVLKNWNTYIFTISNQQSKQPIYLYFSRLINEISIKTLNLTHSWTATAIAVISKVMYIYHQYCYYSSRM